MREREGGHIKERKIERKKEMKNIKRGNGIKNSDE